MESKYKEKGQQIGNSGKKLAYLKRLLEALHQTEVTLIKWNLGFPPLLLRMNICEDSQGNSGNVKNAFALKSEYSVQTHDPTPLVSRTAAAANHHNWAA